MFPQILKYKYEKLHLNSTEIHKQTIHTNQQRNHVKKIKNVQINSLEYIYIFVASRSFWGWH